MENSTQNKIKCPKCGCYNHPQRGRCTDCGALLIFNPSVDPADQSEKVSNSRSFAPYIVPCVVGAAGIALICVFSVIAYGMGKVAERDYTVSGLDSELSAKQGYVSALDDYVSKKEAYDADVSSMQASLSALSSQADALKKSIQQNGSPIKLPAGQFTVGKDIPSGRYKVTGSSNLFVDGSTTVNTILGGSIGGGLGVDSYICQLSDGDKIRAEGADTFTPVF